jgi:BirA family biotin operon repressor/biotin-[acetyl-CoA-carboxylase] ligase
MKKINNYYYKNFLIHHYDEINSTNDLAIELIKDRQIFDREIILADQQNKGRGRFDRNWNSPRGNLYFSLVLDGKIANKNLGLSRLSSLSLVANIALNHALTSISNQQNIKLDISNKWPNDLLIENNKIAGILLENIIINNKCEFLILGIGVNVKSNPQNNIFSANNLENLMIKITCQKLLEIFLDIFENLFMVWQNYGFKNLRELWLKNAYKLKEEILINDSQTMIKGIFEDLDELGNLLLKTSKKTILISAGDILNPNINL